MRPTPLLALAVLTLAACGTGTEPAAPVSSTPVTGSTACPPPGATDGGWLCAGPAPDDEALARADQERLARLPSISDEEAERLDEERLREIEALDPADPATISPTGDLPRAQGTVLVRTDFAHPEQWAALVAALSAPADDGHVPWIATVDHPRWDGAAVEEVIAAGAPGGLLVLADATTLASPDLPLLVVEQVDGATEQLRVTPGAFWSVENDLALADLDWQDFTGSVDPDGVFRGFDRPGRTTHSG